MSYDGSEMYYDNHTLYCIVYDATYDQISDCIKDAINKIGVECAYQINLVETKDGNRYAYMRVSDDKVYNALIGRNLDGTERIELHDDPDFKMPDTPFEEAMKERLLLKLLQM